MKPTNNTNQPNQTVQLKLVHRDNVHGHFTVSITTDGKPVCGDYLLKLHRKYRESPSAEWLKEIGEADLRKTVSLLIQQALAEYQRMFEAEGYIVECIPVGTPQLEEGGFLSLAHDLLEDLMKSPAIDQFARVYLAVIRGTYGWSIDPTTQKRKSRDQLWRAISSQRFIALTGLPLKRISEALRRLLKENMVERRLADDKSRGVYEYRPQKDASEWAHFSGPVRAAGFKEFRKTGTIPGEMGSSEDLNGQNTVLEPSGGSEEFRKSGTDFSERKGSSGKPELRGTENRNSKIVDSVDHQGLAGNLKKSLKEKNIKGASKAGDISGSGKQEEYPGLQSTPPGPASPDIDDQGPAKPTRSRATKQSLALGPRASKLINDYCDRHQRRTGHQYTIPTKDRKTTEYEKDGVPVKRPSCFELAEMAVTKYRDEELEAMLSHYPPDWVTNPSLRHFLMEESLERWIDDRAVRAALREQREAEESAMSTSELIAIQREKQAARREDILANLLEEGPQCLNSGDPAVKQLVGDSMIEHRPDLANSIFDFTAAEIKARRLDRDRRGQQWWVREVAKRAQDIVAGLSLGINQKTASSEGYESRVLGDALDLLKRHNGLKPAEPTQDDELPWMLVDGWLEENGFVKAGSCRVGGVAEFLIKEEEAEFRKTGTTKTKKSAPAGEMNTEGGVKSDTSNGGER